MEFIMKLGKGVKSSFVSFFDFIREGVKELKKVRWPNRKELTTYTTIVLFTVVFVAVFFFVIDLGVSFIMQLFGLGK